MPLRNPTVLLLLLAACGPSRGPDVIFLPSAADVVDRMLALAGVGPEDVVYDLGCGDGRIVIAAVRRHGARGVCVDIDPARVEESRRNADAAGVAGRIRFVEGDLFETDLEEATVVTLYLSPPLNRRLRPKLFRELRPGARIVSHNFDMGEWKPDSVVRVQWPAGTTSTIYHWVLPADVAGTWELTVGVKRRYRLRLEQHYQRVDGTASIRGRPVPLGNAVLHGRRLAFTLADSADGKTARWRFHGRVTGATISGTVVTGRNPDTRAWRAARR